MQSRLGARLLYGLRGRPSWWSAIRCFQASFLPSSCGGVAGGISMACLRTGSSERRLRANFGSTSSSSSSLPSSSAAAASSRIPPCHGYSCIDAMTRGGFDGDSPRIDYQLVSSSICRGADISCSNSFSSCPHTPVSCKRVISGFLPTLSGLLLSGRIVSDLHGGYVAGNMGGVSGLLDLDCMRQSVRFKMVKVSAYRRRSRASPTGQSQKAHLGVCRLSAEYVTPGCILVRQRRYIAWGFESKRRKRHQKFYPGENVGVSKNSSLVALVHGRVKYTHDVSRDLMLCNVLPEPREELLREDLWRYRTEHVLSKEENRFLCHRRRKGIPSFPRPPINPPTKPLPRPDFLSDKDMWQYPTLRDAPPLDEDR